MIATGRTSRGLVAALAVAGLAAAAWRAPWAAPARFAGASPPTAAVVLQPRGSVDLPATVPSAHASTLAVRPDGQVLVAWFAGTREGARDVAIHMARLDGGQVADHWVALTRERLAEFSGRSVRKVGNPVLWVPADGSTHLFVTCVGVGGWSGSGVVHLRSTDGGRSWDRARRLVLAPFLDLGTLVRAAPVPLEDGSVLLPCYREFLHKHGIAVRVSQDGRVLDAAPIPSPLRTLQPAVAATAPADAVAVLRCGDRSVARVVASRTADGGATWTSAAPIDVPNPDSSVALVRLRDGSLLMAANPAERGRSRLGLLRSTDGGASWTDEATVEQGEEGSEFSYPTLVASDDGGAWLSYTFRRTGIRVRRYAAAPRAEAAP